MKKKTPDYVLKGLEYIRSQRKDFSNVGFKQKEVQERIKQQAIKKYGGMEGYRAEMRRRRMLRETEESEEE